MYFLCLLHTFCYSRTAVFLQKLIHGFNISKHKIIHVVSVVYGVRGIYTVVTLVYLCCLPDEQSVLHSFSEFPDS